MICSRASSGIARPELVVPMISNMAERSDSSSEVAAFCSCSRCDLPVILAFRRISFLAISWTRSSISAAPSSAALAYLSCQSLRSAATISRALRRVGSSCSSFSSTSGGGIGSIDALGRASAEGLGSLRAGADAGADADADSTDEVAGTEAAGLVNDELVFVEAVVEESVTGFGTDFLPVL